MVGAIGVLICAVVADGVATVDVLAVGAAGVVAPVAVVVVTTVEAVVCGIVVLSLSLQKQFVLLAE